jgi:hypothetical protein
MNTLTVQCGCGATLGRRDADHGMRCSAPAALTTLRHDILKGILRHAVHQPGIASALKPALCRGAGTSADGSAMRVEARGDIVLILPQGISIADVCVIHHLSPNALPRAAVTAGTAAMQGDQQKRTACARVEPHGYGLVPFSV